MINRREFIGQMSLATAGVGLVTSSFSAQTGNRSSHSLMEEFVIADTSYGKIKGLRTEGVNIFKGIPYAGSVSGERRFRRPAPLESWSGVRDALNLGAPAIQAPRRNEPAPSEDCLFLNVWTPANDNKKRPVMFYNHGGGFVIGSGGSAGQDGANLARNFDVVVVETNHRLGIMGFLYLDRIAGADYEGSGNNGMLDIVEGLKWVNQNIAQFGGDPNNVMIWGESGGGAKTSCLYAMPSAAPYFNKASIESGPGVRMMNADTAHENTLQLLKEFNIAPENWRKLLDIPAADLLAMQAKLPFVAPFQEKNKEMGIMRRNAGGFGPVVDGKALLSHPFDPSAPNISKNKPLLVGWNEDEYAFFAWERKESDFATYTFEALQNKLSPTYGANTSKIIETYRKSRPAATAGEIYIAISSIAMMGLGSVEIAEKKSKQGGAPVYLYNFGYKSEVKIPGTEFAMGTPHAMDISFKFNNESANKPSFFGGNRPEKAIASHNFAELWTNFAKTGKPFAANAPEWKAYNLKDRTTMRIDTKLKIIKDRFKEELNVWREVGRL
ncbi:MAG: carboxylesterase/lipase family protein [Aquirufa sp.]